jgi:hypothetical protein
MLERGRTVDAIRTQAQRLDSYVQPQKSNVQTIWVGIFTSVTLQSWYHTGKIFLCTLKNSDYSVVLMPKAKKAEEEKKKKIYYEKKEKKAKEVKK